MMKVLAVWALAEPVYPLGEAFWQMSAAYSDFIIQLLPIGTAVEVDYCTRSGQSTWRALFLGNLTDVVLLLVSVNWLYLYHTA